eukprot:jgi/Tetstr1/433457/TSEL_022731.t1
MEEALSLQIRQCLRLVSLVDGAAAEAKAEAEAEAERAVDAECAANIARLLAFAKFVAATVSWDAEAEVEAFLDIRVDRRPQRPNGPQSTLVTLLDEPTGDLERLHTEGVIVDGMHIDVMLFLGAI